MDLAKQSGWSDGRALSLILAVLLLVGSSMAQNAQNDPNAGIPRFSTQIAGQYDSVNPATSNILFSLPIRDKTGKIPFSLKLLSNFHMYDNNGTPLSWVGTLGRQMFNLSVSAGDLGGSLGFATQQTTFACKPGMFFTQYSNFVVFDETGASHSTLPIIIYTDPSCGQTQGTAQTTDGSGYTVNLSVQQTTDGAALNWSIIDKSGNVRTQNPAIALPPATMTDTDGIEVTSVPTQQGFTITRTITDSLGQPVLTATTTPFVPGGTVPGGAPSTYQYTDVNGNTETVTVNYSQYSVQTNFGCSGFADLSYTDFLPSSIVMPDGETFKLSYEPTPGNSSSVTGRIAQMSLPLGGSISYAYSGGNNGIYCAFQGSYHSIPTLTRTVNDGNGNVAKWTYVNNDTTGSVSPYTVTETDPENNVTVYTFVNVASGLASLTPYETQRQIYQGAQASQNLLKTIQTCYNGNFSNCLQTGPTVIGLTPAVTQTDVYTYLNGSSSGTLVETKYNLSTTSTGAPVTLTGTVAEVKEYDVGATIPPSGSPVRDTTTTYGSWNGTSCDTLANIVNHPCELTTVDSSGNTVAQTRFTYNAAGHPTQVSRLVSGSTYINTSATYAANGVMTSSTDANGNVTSYTNGACNNFLRTQSQTGNLTTSQIWDCNGGVVTSRTDQNGNITNYAYKDANGNADPLWRLLSVAYPDGGQTAAAYNLLSSPPNITTTELIDSSHSLATQTNFDGLGRTVQKLVTSDPDGADTVDTKYDLLGHVLSVSNPHRSASAQTDGITTYQYDALGRATQVAPPDGTIPTAGSPCQANNVCSSYSGYTTTTTDQAGNQRRSITDGLGRLIEVDEPGSAFAGTTASGSLTIGGILQSVVVGAHGAIPATLTVAVSGEGPCTGPPSNLNCDVGTVTMTVGSDMETLSYGGLTTAQTIAQNFASQFNKDSTQVTAVASQVSDSLHWQIAFTAKATGANGNGIAFSSSQKSFLPGQFPVAYTFSPAGGNTSGGQNASSGTTVFDAGTVEISIDGFSATANYGSSAGQDSSASAVATDLVGQIQSKLPGSNPPFTISRSSAAINIQWNSPGIAGNIAVTTTSTTSQTGNFSKPSFASCSITSNPQTCGTNLSGGQNPSPSSLANPYLSLYTNDALGNLTCVVQKGSDTTAFTSCGAAPATWRPRSFIYDRLSRLLSATNPESGAISYEYDGNGNLLQKISPAPNQNGTATQIISYCYDIHNRVTGKAYSAQACTNGQLPAGTAVVTYTYDAGTNGAGYLTSLTDQAGSGSYTYDLMGRISTESRTIAGVTKNMSYLYNLDGSIKAVTYPSAAVITYTAGSAGRPLSAIDGGNSINYVTGPTGPGSNVTYTPDGSVLSYTNGWTSGFAGISNAFTYNDRLQPVNMSAASPAQAIFNLTYDFHLGNGDNGNVFAIANNRDTTRNQAFTYDTLDRLVSAQNSGTDCSQATLNPNQTKFWGNSYSYDPWGNLLSKSVTKCSAEALNASTDTNNRIHSISGPDYQYDAAGNMTVDVAGPLAPQTYTFDPENRITGAGGFTYTYDADGNRVEKSNGSSGTLYWYMSPGIVAESDLSGNLKSEYVFFDGRRVARKDFSGGTTAVSYYFSDHLGTASVIINAAGTITEDEDFYPWGGELPFVSGDTNHYKFTGKERDSETGLDYFGARYYGNALGRFLSADWAARPEAVPYSDLHDPQSLNLYSYVRNIPTVDVDGDGHEVQESGGYDPPSPYRVIDCTVEQARCQILRQKQTLEAQNAQDAAKHDVAIGALKEGVNTLRGILGQSVPGSDQILQQLGILTEQQAANPTQERAMKITALLSLLIPVGGEEVGESKLAGRLTQLYAKFAENGIFQKWGISVNALKRYGSSKGIEIITQGPREAMLALERWLTKRAPGPQNIEPYAGSKFSEKALREVEKLLDRLWK